MSQPVASPVPDAAAGSPGPAPSRRSSALDSILRASEERYSPNNFYGLDLKYRNDPRYNPKSHFVTIAKGAGRSSPLSPASSPRSPRPVRVWANSPLLCGVGLSRSLSLPTVLPSDDEAGLDDGTGALVDALVAADEGRRVQPKTKLDAAPKSQGPLAAVPTRRRLASKGGRGLRSSCIFPSVSRGR